MLTARFILCSLCLGAPLLAISCSSHAPKSPQSDAAKKAARTRLLSSPTAAITVGETAVIAIDPQWKLDLDARSPTGRLDDGRTIPLSIYWAVPQRNTAAPGWIADFGPWKTTPEDHKQSATNSGVRLVSFSPPTDALGQGIWIGNKRIDLQWMPSAEMIAASNNWSWTPTLTPEQRADSRLHDLIKPEAHNPLTRWRLLLLLEGLKPGPHSTDTFDDPVLENWALQEESIWRAALRKIQKHDSATAANFVARLTQIVTLPDGAIVPLWPATDADLLGLVEDMVHDSVTPKRAAEMAEAWLEAQPIAAGWIANDAAGLGVSSPSGGGDTGNAVEDVVLSTVGIVNLSGKPALATLQAGGPAELARLEPSTAIERLIATHSAPTAASTSALPQLHFQLLDWDATRTVVAIPIKIAPPGFSIGPMIPNWTMADFYKSDETSLLATRPDDCQITLTHNGQLSSGTGAESLSGWTLIIISLAPPAIQESFTIYFGPANKSSGTIRIASDGATKNTGYGGSCQTSITRLSTGWGCEIALPNGVIDKAGRLSLGLSSERTTSPGPNTTTARASWPRAQFPWQSEPGRVMIDTKGWGGLIEKSK